jgi:hypothetical protein
MVQGMTVQADLFTYEQLHYLIMDSISNQWDHHTKVKKISIPENEDKEAAR